MGIAVVNDKRKALFGGNVQLAFKGPNLLFRGRTATKEIKAYLAPGNDLGLRSKASQILKIPGIRFIGVVGDDTLRWRKCAYISGDFNRFSRTGEVNSNGYNARHPPSTALLISWSRSASNRPCRGGHGCRSAYNQFYPPCIIELLGC